MDEVEVVESPQEEVSQEVSEQTEIAPQETTSPENEAPTPVDEHEEKNARNWRRANEKRKQLERDLRKRDDQIEELVRAVTRKDEVPAEVDELDTTEDSDFIPKGQVSKLIQREANKIREDAKKQVEQELHKREQSRWKQRITERYPDFEDVVNLDTLDLLEQEDPEMSETIAELKDPYKVGLQTYKFIKASGLSDRVGSMRRGREVETKMKENAKTVQSPQVYDKRPLAQAHKVTQAEKKALYAEMMSAASSGGSGY